MANDTVNIKTFSKNLEKSPPTEAELKYNTPSFKGKSTVTMHYCDTCVKFVWQWQVRRTFPPRPMQYKSLIIGLLPCRQMCFSSRAHWALGGATGGIRLTLSERLRYVYPGGCSPRLLKGCPAERAVHQQTSHSVKSPPPSALEGEQSSIITAKSI